MLIKTVLILATLNLSAFLVTNNVSLDYFKANSAGDRVILEWKSFDESGLVEFELERKLATESDFTVIKKFQPEGQGSIYQFVDKGLYKTTDQTVFYRLKIITNDGYAYMEASSTYTSTAIRRTWGSIKAMFK